MAAPSLLQGTFSYPASLEQIAEDLELHYGLHRSDAEEALGNYILRWRGRGPGSPTAFARRAKYPLLGPIPLADTDKLGPRPASKEPTPGASPGPVSLAVF